jgi:serine phosphatase RsbU (regulator of sigma subunit)
MSADQRDDDSSISDKTNIFTGTIVPAANQIERRAPGCLVLLTGPSELIGRQWRFDKPKLILGRATTADLHVPDSSVSKQHAQIEILERKVFLTDLASTNGTYLDGKKLTENHAYQLNNNCQIRIGNLIFKFLERGIVSETAEKSRMQSELKSARMVQESLLPIQKSARYEWLEISGYYQSATECGGDWWWYWRCANKAFAFIGDITGHGAAAAMITSAARSAIGTIEENPATRAEDVYTVLTRALLKSSKGNMTMSGLIVEVNLDTRVGRFINASHPPALLLSKSDTNITWRDIVSLNVPSTLILGAPEEKSAQATEVALLPNMRLVLVTDGLTERLDAKGKALNERAFNTMLIQCHAANTESQTNFLQKLIAESDNKSAAAPLADDITVVVLDFHK